MRRAARGRDAAAVDHLGRLQPHAAGRAVGTGAGVDAAAVDHLARGFQHDAPAALRQAGGLDAAGVAHHPTLHPVQRLRAQDHQPARGQHQMAVVHQRAQGGSFHPQPGQRLVGVELQFKRLARRQRHRAQVGHDHALVAHLRRQQRDVAAQGRAQLAFVDHAAGGALALEAGAAGHEVVQADAVRGGHQAAHVHAGAGREVHAVGVGQEHLPVGGDAAEDLAGVRPLHAVERDRLRRRLLELHLRITPDVELLPVDRAPRAALLDRQRGAVLLDGHLPRHHLPARGQGVGRHLGPGRQRQQRGGHEQAGCAAFAAGTGVLGGGHPGAGDVVPDQAVDLVHGLGGLVWVTAVRSERWPAARCGGGAGCRPDRGHWWPGPAGCARRAGPRWP